MTFYEIIDGLIDAGDLLITESERVPADKRSNKDYEDARDMIHQELSDVEDVTTACYHESAHYAYSVFLGYKLKRDVTHFKVVGPSIKFHSPTDTEPEWYEPTPTAVSAPGLQLPYDSESLEELALIAVAGGESVRWFRPGQKRGNRSDYKRFKQVRKLVFGRLHPDYRDTIKPVNYYWKKAAQEVRNEFKQGLHNQLIDLKSQLVMTEVFGPVFSSTKETL
jgi:hypothetical protein